MPRIVTKASRGRAASGLTMLLVLLVAMLVTGCGGGGGGGSTADSTGASTASTEASAPESGGAAAEIPITEPLKGKPPAKKLAWLQCEVPQCATYTKGFEEATEALGWQLDVVNFKAEAPGSAIQSALDQGAGYIAMTGVPNALIKPQLAAAKAKGVPILSCFSSDPPSATGVAMQCGDQTMIRSESEELAQWIINDSGDEANVVMVVVRDYPLIAYEEEVLAERLKACSGCSFKALPVTVGELGEGAVPQAVASYLQSNPDTNYVEFGFGDLATGVHQSLKAAGLGENVKLVGMSAVESNLQGIKDGTEDAWTVQPSGYAAWLMTDAAARLSLGMPLSQERKAADMPTLLVTDPSEAEPLLETNGEWPGPTGFQDYFRKLWGVSASG
ncbi:MAG: sugar ABC transporter substrate-binding protein [Solirubrobacterales bacterium]